MCIRNGVENHGAVHNTSARTSPPIYTHNKRDDHCRAVAISTCLDASLGRTRDTLKFRVSRMKTSSFILFFFREKYFCLLKLSRNVLWFDNILERLLRLGLWMYLLSLLPLLHRPESCRVMLMEWNQLAMLCWPAHKRRPGKMRSKSFYLCIFYINLYAAVAGLQHVMPTSCGKKKKKKKRQKKNFFLLFTKEGNTRIIVITTLNHLFDGWFIAYCTRCRSVATVACRTTDPGWHQCVLTVFLGRRPCCKDVKPKREK